MILSECLEFLVFPLQTLQNKYPQRISGFYMPAVLKYIILYKSCEILI